LFRAYISPKQIYNTLFYYAIDKSGHKWTKVDKAGHARGLFTESFLCWCKMKVIPGFSGNACTIV